MSLLGANPFAVILCKPSDQPQQPQPASWFQGFLAGSNGLAGYWSSVANGQFSIQGTQVFNWRFITQNLAALQKLSRGGKVNACKAAFPDVDFSKFFGVIAIVNVVDGDAGYAGGAGVLLDPPAWVLGTAQHESGHALGLDHSFDDRPNSCDANDDNRAGAYSDGWCIMSYACFGGANPTFSTQQYGSSGPGLCGAYRDKLGWIPQNRISAGPPANSTQTLAALNHPEVSGHLLQKIYVDNDPNQYYTVEFRQKQSWDAGIAQDTVLFHMVKDGRAYLIRAGGGPQRLPGSIYVDNANTPTVSITVNNLNSAASTASVSVDVSPLGPPAIGDPATMVTDNQQHIFYRGAEGNIYHQFWDTSSGLHSEQWAGPGGPIAAPASAGKPSTMVTGGNQQHVFYRGMDEAIYQVVYDSNRGLYWERWAGPGSSTGTPGAAGDPATMVANNQQHVFYRTGDGKIYHVLFDPGSLLDPSSGLHSEQWAGSGSSTGAPAAAGDPATMVTDNQQHIFYRTVSNGIQHVFWDSSSGLHSEQWADPGSSFGDPATMVANGQQHIFYTADSGAVYHVFYDSKRGLVADRQPWAGPNSSTNAPPALGNPATMVTADQQHIFYRTTASGIYHVFFDQTNSTMHAESWALGSSAGDPATMVANSQQHIFYRTNDGSVIHTYFDGKTGRHTDSWSTPGTGKAVPQPAVGDPATMVTGTQQHIFYRNAAQDVLHTFWDQGSGAIKTEQWAGRITPPPGAAGDPAVMVTGNQQHLFYVSDASALIHVFWDSSGGLQTKSWVGTPPSKGPTTSPAQGGRPATLIASGQQHVFYRGIDNNLYHVFWDPNSRINSGIHAPEQWGGPGSSTGAPAAAGNPATMFDNNQQHVFYRTASNDIYHVFYDQGSHALKAEAWTGSSSPKNAPPAAGDPATLVTTNQQHIFYRTTTGGIQHVFFDHTNGPHSEQWGGPGGLTQSPFAWGDPATLFANGQQHVFYRGLNGDIVHLFWDPSSGLRAEPWVGPGGMTNAPAPSGNPVTMAANNQQHIFYRGTDNNIYHVFWDQRAGVQWEHWTIGLSGWVAPWP
jgi:hypothetical protein